MEQPTPGNHSDTSVDIDVKHSAQEIETTEKDHTLSASTDPQFSQARTKTLLRKLDWHLVPFLSLLYLYVHIPIACL